ncbi:MAG: ATP-binding cassette domain-containing protein [Chitinophagales bacterium]
MEIEKELVIDIKDLSKGYYPNEKGEFGFYALNNINVQFYKNQRIGVIGENGSGKSTLLKILSGLIKPTNGSAVIKGKVNALIELGSNFIPDLTGRENTNFFLKINGINGSLKNDFIDEIKEFSGLGKYFEQPVKHYSSGMFVRLALSAGFHINADLFFIDEVLQAGDAAFREKASSYFKEITNDGATLLLASHSPDEILENCTDCIWLEEGQIKMLGKAGEVVENYYKSMTKSYAESKYFPEKDKNIVSQKIKFSNNINKTQDKLANELIEVLDFKITPVDNSSDITYENGFKIKITVLKKIEGWSLHLMIVLYDIYMKPIISLVSSNNKSIYEKLNSLKHKKGEMTLECNVPPNLLSSGVFYADFMFGKDPEKGELYTEEAYKLPVKIKFEVKEGINTYDFSGAGQNVFIKPLAEWKVNDHKMVE